MNGRQKLFVKYYTEGETKGNATASAVKAGYKWKFANQAAPRLLGHVRIEEAISLRLEYIDKAEKLTIESVNADFEYAKEQCKAKRGDKSVLIDKTNYVRICENQAKHVGFYGADNAQKVEQVKLDQAEATEAQRIANILNIEDARKGKVG